MKTCKKCGAQCKDSQIYCQACGANLEEKKDVVTKVTETVKEYGQDSKAYTDGYFGDKENYRNGLEKIYKAHGGFIIGILAIAVVWWYWDIMGLVFGVLGIYICKFEDSQTMKILGYVFNGLAVALGIFSLLLG